MIKRPYPYGMLCALLYAAALPAAANWTLQRGDSLRSGYTEEALSTNLVLRWTYTPRHAPRPAWSGRDTRMPFDQAYHVVADGGRIFFGSSADGKVYALDAETGAERWSFFTGGPVRFAPAIWQDRVFVVSDDGFLYCLAVDDGRLLWKLRGGADDTMVMGNDRMVSRWPARGGLVLFGNTVYFAAGIWPSEQIYVYAVNATDGTVLWKNDTSGTLVMEQPHGGNRSRSGISAQGYLAADEARLYVPSGRGVPAVLDRATGKLLYFHLAANHYNGGADIVVGDGVFYNAWLPFNAETGIHYRGIGRHPPERTVTLPGRVLHWHAGNIRGFEWTDVDQVDAQGKTNRVHTLQETWALSLPHHGVSMIMAGERCVLGAWPHGSGVHLLDVATKRIVWSAKVDGPPLGLAVAEGRLFVSTDKGLIYAFSPGDKSEPVEPLPVVDDAPYGDNVRYARAAEKIVRQTGVTEGYAVDLGCGVGALTYELAKRTKLQIYAVEDDPAKVAIARERLDRAGLYGVRVTLHQGDPAHTPYPGRFANLVVSARSVTAGRRSVDRNEAERLQRPCGGVVCVGGRFLMKKTVRGKQPGAADWTHQYADAANTMCSPDRLAKGPLQMVWFTDFGFSMPNRHGRGPAPLCKNGILVVEGVDELLGVDAYNGRKLWSFTLKDILKPYNQEHLLGTAGTGGNMCIGGDSIYLREGGRCLRLGLQTGEEQQEYPIPASAGETNAAWGYVAWMDGTLFGTRTNRKHVPRFLFGGSDMTKLMTESHNLFAIDTETGKHKWTYEARHSIRHNAIAIGAGKVYLVDRPAAQKDRLKPGTESGSAADGRIVCLDADSGKILWQADKDIYGTTLGLSEEHGILVMGYQLAQRGFQLPSEKGNRLSGFNSLTGERLWDTAASYISRPILNGRLVITQPYAYDLLTGKRDESFALTDRQPGGCGPISGSANLLLYRSGVLGYYDLIRRAGTEHYGGPRPGCWVNAIAAGGMVLMPDATDRCACSYVIKASFALEAKPQGVEDTQGDKQE